MDNLWICLINPLVMTNIAIEHGRNDVDLPLKHGNFPQLYDFTRGYPGSAVMSVVISGTHRTPKSTAAFEY